MGKKLDFEELVEIEISGWGVDRFVKPFDYSDQEWAEIESSAQSARAGPLTEDVRMRLRRAGEVYLTLHSAGREFLKRRELTFVANWATINSLSAALHEHLVEANARSADDRKYRRLLKSLAQLRDDAGILSSKSPPLALREDYYRKILGVWVDKLGGKLGLSRETVSHRLGGPLVKFFQAVTRPVLASDAPALETISDIIGREKERRKKSRKAGVLAPVPIARSLEKPAPTPDTNSYFTDLGPLQINPNIPFESQVHNYVVERSRATGLPHMVAVDTEGMVLIHASGSPNRFLLPNKLAAALYNPDNKIVIHRDNPFNRTLHDDDITCLALPGVAAVYRHGNAGVVARAALMPKARAKLRGKSLQEACSSLYRIVSGIEVRLYDVLLDAIRSGKISIDQANGALPHLIGLTLRRAGILDYSWNGTLSTGRLGSKKKSNKIASAGTNDQPSGRG